MATVYDSDQILEIMKHHLEKALQFNPFYNFPQASNKEEFSSILRNDPAFVNLGLDDERYVSGRFGGNLITSLHRKIGDMYEEIFRYLVKTRFSLSESYLDYHIDLEIGGRTQKRSTDGIIPITYLKDFEFSGLDDKWKSSKGLGFEVRSCYQIGDSKRIQADWDMSLALKNEGLTPIMLIFCNTSLRSPVSRLSRSWELFEGDDTFRFIYELTGFNLGEFMEQNSSFLKKMVDDILAKI